MAYLIQEHFDGDINQETWSKQVQNNSSYNHVFTKCLFYMDHLLDGT